MENFYSKTVDETYSSVGSSKTGITTEEATSRLAKYGKNELDEAKKKSLFLRFIDQLKDVMILVLLVAAAISATLAIIEKNYTDLIDSGLIVLIVIINAIIGLIQEGKAEAAMESLKNLNKPFCKVIRDGAIQSVKSEELVVGDIVVLEAGDIVPADIRLIETASLKIEEASLTGESLPSQKEADCVLNDKTPLGDRKNMAYSSGSVAYGRGKGIVVSTGMNTEVGKIATMLSEAGNTTTPLQVQLAKTAKVLSIIVLVIAAVIFGASILKSGFEIDSIVASFMTAVAIAVAAIPEGLPAVVTIVLAVGVKRMSERKAIVRNLPAVETLGCCQIICSDKTGTLTLNKMTVRNAYTTDSGLFDAETELNKSDYSKDMLVRAMVLCNDTIIGEKLVGDPTETALVAYAQKHGYDVAALNAAYPRVDENPFDSNRKLMSVKNDCDGKVASYIKGATDILINKCAFILDGKKIRPITEDDKIKINEANAKMAHKALRVLGVAIKEGDCETTNMETDMVFVGLVGMIDPPRQEVKDAVKTCKRAGMRPIMITGDHIDTASAIAKEIGILRDGDLVITGAELDKLSDEEYKKNLFKYSVYARVSPENKVRIVKAFKSFDLVVAMTGDGVNDAPSIKSADIGIGMGITGTDVSKGAADIVLADDNFATIIAAVEEGRKVYSNIKKAIQYLLSANIAEVLCLFIATLFLLNKGQSFLTPVMILWVNLVTDSLPALALGIEKAEKNVMDQQPRKQASSLLSGKTGKDIFIQGIMQTILVLASYCIGNYVLPDGVENHAVAMTMAFVTLCFIQLFHSYNMRSQNQTIFHKDFFSNRFLNISFLVGAALVLITVLIPQLHGLFDTASLSGTEWLISIALSVAIIPFVELQKFIERLVDKKKEIKE